jgi:hypothetical protein
VRWMHGGNYRCPMLSGTPQAGRQACRKHCVAQALLGQRHQRCPCNHPSSNSTAITNHTGLENNTRNPSLGSLKAGSQRGVPSSTCVSCKPTIDHNTIDPQLSETEQTEQ